MTQHPYRRAGDQRQGYRKGIVLGLTLAEVALLLVFLLLLLFSSNLLSRDRKFAKYENKEAVEKARLSALEKQEKTLQAIKTALNVQSELPDEDFVNLVRTTANSAEAKAALAAVTAAAEARQRSEQILENVSKIALGDESKKAMAKSMIEQQDQIANQRGQIDFLRRQIADAGLRGNGKELPPCWTSKTDRGGIDYLFDVVLTSDGIRVGEREHPERPGYRERLNVRTMDPGEVMPPSDFLAATAALYKESAAQKCTHYVFVFDSTERHEKIRYKQLLRAVEGHFYKLERNDTAPF